jgi:hypothetical protein
MRHFLFAALVLLITGCSQSKLTVFSEYLSIETLPSYIIGTPDPRLYNPDVGTRIHIKWNIPPHDYLQEGLGCALRLKLSLYFGNRTEEKLWVDLSSPSGIYIYTLINEAYWEKEGIFTYQVELYSDDLLIETWQHLLYTERITIEGEEGEDMEEEREGREEAKKAE